MKKMPSTVSIYIWEIRKPYILFILSKDRSLSPLFFFSTYGVWRWNGARQKRPMSSIVLQPGVKDMLLADCKDFLCSEEWYVWFFFWLFGKNLLIDIETQVR